jgi:hypothetical protein
MLLACAFVCACATVAAGSFTNPVHNTDTPDPGVIFADGLYFAAVTGGDFSILQSADLSSWTVVGSVFPKGAFLLSFPVLNAAPCCCARVHVGVVYLSFTATHPLVLVGCWFTQVCLRGLTA